MLIYTTIRPSAMSKTITAAPDEAAAKCRLLIPALSEAVDPLKEIQSSIQHSIETIGRLPPYTASYPGGRMLRKALKQTAEAIDGFTAAREAAEASDLPLCIEHFRRGELAATSANSLWEQSRKNPLPL